MVKAVTGFLSRNGERFFETEAKAKHYDAAFDLRTSATDAVVGLGINDQTHVTTLVQAFEKFLIDEADLVLEYLTTAREIQADEQRKDEMDGQSARDNSSDDPRVRPDPDKQVVEEATAERKPAKSRGRFTPDEQVPS